MINPFLLLLKLAHSSFTSFFIRYYLTIKYFQTFFGKKLGKFETYLFKYRRRLFSMINICFKVSFYFWASSFLLSVFPSSYFLMEILMNYTDEKTSKFQILIYVMRIFNIYIYIYNICQ